MTDKNDRWEYVQNQIAEIEKKSSAHIEYYDAKLKAMAERVEKLENSPHQRKIKDGQGRDSYVDATIPVPAQPRPSVEAIEKRYEPVVKP